MALKYGKDHWAFLEEIEAPMWVDLALEAKSSDQLMCDAWLHTSHPFHQCSSSQLKAAFAHSGDTSMSSDFDFKRPSSPKLPSSVSRSRGKHYSGNKRMGEDRHLLNKQHPVKALTGSSSYVDSESVKEIKPKLSFINAKGTSRSSITSKMVFTGNSKEKDLKAISRNKSLGNSSSTSMDKAGESNTSTITSENDQRSQQKNFEISSRPLTHTSGLLSAMRTSLRKSCVTRQASRVESNDDKWESGNRKSSSGKSSVGSSVNPGYDVESSAISVQNKEKTPDSRNVMRMPKATKDTVNNSKISKASNVQVKNGTGNFRRGGVSNTMRSVHQETTKSKVQNYGIRGKPLLDKVNEKSSLISTAKDKQNARVGGFNKSVGTGKENATGRMPASQNCSSRNIATGKNRDQEGTNKNVARNLPGTGCVGTKGKIISPSKRNRSTNGAPKVYFR